MFSDMESIGTEEINKDSTIVAKGKRTKRQRPLSPCAVPMASSCSSASGVGGDYGSFSSTTVNTFESAESQEEEDMAHCLILLAQGKSNGGNNNKVKKEMGIFSASISSASATTTPPRIFSEMANPTTPEKGFYVYECKTCNRTFPSFQALGGHRASHKRPKVTPLEERKLPSGTPNCEFEEANQEALAKITSSSHPISFQLGCGGTNNNNNKSNFVGNKVKIHECSICGSEFTSGQALGGHMRRHRAATNSTTGAQTNSDIAATVEVRPRNVLELDLNLPPAPEEDLRETKFQFTATKKSMVLSTAAAPALVGCHY